VAQPGIGTLVDDKFDADSAMRDTPPSAIILVGSWQLPDRAWFWATAKTVFCHVTDRGRPRLFRLPFRAFGATAQARVRRTLGRGFALACLLSFAELDAAGIAAVLAFAGCIGLLG
jgi:hypothetical protein